MELAAKATVADSTACWAKAYSSAQWSALKGKLPDFHDNGLPPMSLLVDRTKPTEAEAAMLLSFHQEYVTPCRKLTLNDIGNVHPSLTAVFAQAYANSDAEYAKLVQRQETWGEFAQAYSQEKQRFIAALDNAGGKIQQQLDASYRYEIQQRQAAADAFSNWAYQQQVIAALNQMAQPRAVAPPALQVPQMRTINCTRYYNTVNCTSY
ncbi:MAG: hypothetical protein JSR91_00455 [Proteobacteria bacterium]|nr:hypothetical protein [Pseudomonadota bacterium]